MRHSIATQVRRFLSDRNGATAIEYALIASGIAAALVAVIGRLGGTVNTLWTSVSTSLH